MLFARNFSEIGIDPEALEDRESIDRPEPMTVREHAENYWLSLHESGASIRQIATIPGVPSYPTVYRGIHAARRRRALEASRVPHVTPILDSVGYRPDQPCGHRGAIRTGSGFFCPECYDTGIRNHPELKLNPNDPLLDQRKKPGKSAGKGKTRKQRRQLAASA